MLNDNIRNYRKKKGMTQEELAVRLHVVRQTVSKWEKGQSVPDAEMLQNIADELGVTVNELLGADFNDDVNRNAVADQLSRINEQLAIRNRRTGNVIRIIAIIFGIIVLLWLILAVAGIGVYSIADGHTFSTAISMDEENPVYSEEEVNEAIAIVRKYFRKNFRGCELIELNYNEEDSKEAFDEWAKQYNAEEAIILTSVFITNSKGGDGSLEPNSTYDNWQWILTKSGEENWTLQTWGY